MLHNIVGGFCSSRMTLNINRRLRCLYGYIILKMAIKVTEGLYMLQLKFENSYFIN
jgi:hypothetical protein